MVIIKSTSIYQIQCVIFLLLMALRVSAGIYLNNIRCAPHETAVATDPKNFRYYPLYINLHRCSGANSYAEPTIRRCNAIESKIGLVETSVIELRSQQWRKIIVYNHTACMYKCIKNEQSCTKYERFKKQSCSCDCTQKTTPSTCRPPFYWNRSRCKCVCPRQHIQCPHGKEFDRGICKCACNPFLRQQCPLGRFDENNCMCYDVKSAVQQKITRKTGVSMGMMVLVATIEFLVLCTIFLLVFYFFFCKLQDNHSYQLGLGKVLSVDQ